MLNILGIDPSLRGTGLAVLNGQTLECLATGDIRIKPSVPEEECLSLIYHTVSDWINRYEIDTVGIEKTIYVQNHQTAIKLGMVRGVILLAIQNALNKDIKVYQYSPKEGKHAVLSGGASKAQVNKMVQALFKVTPKNEDESDALSLAYAASKDRKAELMFN